MKSEVALTQISAYITHKNIAVRHKTTEVMRTVKIKAGLGLNTSQNTHEANDHRSCTRIVKGKRASFAKNIYFAESVDEPGGEGASEMRHQFLCFSSLVHISEFLYVNFPSTCVRCTQLLKS